MRKNLLIGKPRKGMLSKSDDLPKHDTKTPNIGGAGELSIEDGLRSHPPDWDGSSAICVIVVC